MSNTNNVDELVKTATNVAARVLNEAVVPTVHKVLDEMKQDVNGTGNGSEPPYYENIDPDHVVLEIDPDNTINGETTTDTTQPEPQTQVVEQENSGSSELNVERNEKLEEKENETKTKIVKELVKHVASDETFELALTMVKNRLGVNEVTVQSLITIVKYSMEAVELSELKGSEQREMALRLVRRIIVDAPISDDQERLCLDMLDSGVLGQTMDLVVDATNGHVGVNQVIGLAEACCFSFLSSRKKRNKHKGRVRK